MTRSPWHRQGQITASVKDQWRSLGLGHLKYPTNDQVMIAQALRLIGITLKCCHCPQGIGSRAVKTGRQVPILVHSVQNGPKSHWNRTCLIN